MKREREREKERKKETAEIAKIVKIKIFYSHIRVCPRLSRINLAAIGQSH